MTNRNLKGEMYMELLLGGLVLLAIGVLMFTAPQIVYQITQSWKNASSNEPSDFYRRYTRIGGIIFFLVGLTGIITYFVF